jgi:hypothetical protein
MAARKMSARRWSSGTKERTITTNPLKVVPKRETSDQGTHELAVVKPKPRLRARIASRVMPVIRILPYLLAALILIIPVVSATAWDSLLVSYHKIWSAFESGRVVDGVAGLLQVVLLAIAVAGAALTLALVGRRLGKMVWRWSEGKPILRAGLSSARFGLATVAVGAVAVALFTWLPSGNTATTDGGTLSEALERARSQVATLLGTDSDTASAEEADSEASEPGGLLGILAGAVLPDREEERSDDPPTPQPSNDKANTSDKADNGTSSPNNQRINETSEPNPVTLAPREAVPTVTETPPVSTEEPVAIPAEPEPLAPAPLAPAPLAPEPLAPAPLAPAPLAPEPEPPAPEPLVAPAPEPLVAPEPEPLVAPAPEPLVAPAPEPLAPSPQTPPPDTSPNVPEDPNAPPSISCKTVPGDEPGSTVTRCS